MRRTVLLIATASIAMTGCSGETTSGPAEPTTSTTPVDPYGPATVAPTPPWPESRIEREIRTSLLRSAKIATVAKCDEPRRWKTGGKFTCDVLFTYGDQFSNDRIRVAMKPDRTYGWSIRLAG